MALPFLWVQPIARGSDRLLISVLSIVPQPVSEMARDELRALVGG